MDDVTFGGNGPYGNIGGSIPGRSLMPMDALFWILTSKVCPRNLVFGMQSGFISRAVYSRLHVSVCSECDFCCPV